MAPRLPATPGKGARRNLSPVPSAELSQRPNEKASLLNPAFVALVLCRIAAGHSKRSQESLPASLAFLAVPVVLHGPSRNALPRKTTVRLGGWLDEHPVLRAGFPFRAKATAPAVRTGLRAGLRAGVLSLGSDGLLEGTPPRRRKGVVLSDEVEEILERSNFLGAWMSRCGPPVGQFALWRVRP